MWIVARISRTCRRICLLCASNTQRFGSLTQFSIFSFCAFDRESKNLNDLFVFWRHSTVGSKWALAVDCHLNASRRAWLYQLKVFDEEEHENVFVFGKRSMVGVRVTSTGLEQFPAYVKTLISPGNLIVTDRTEQYQLSNRFLLIFWLYAINST